MIKNLVWSPVFGGHWSRCHNTSEAAAPPHESRMAGAAGFSPERVRIRRFVATKEGFQWAVAAAGKSPARRWRHLFSRRDRRLESVDRRGRGLHRGGGLAVARTTRLYSRPRRLLTRLRRQKTARRRFIDFGAHYPAADPAKFVAFAQTVTSLSFATPSG